jgi:hypothetical protein
MEAHFADDWCTLMIARGFYFSCNINGLLHLLLFRCTLEKMVLVPLVGFELTTYRLQGGCSTPELKRL